MIKINEVKTIMEKAYEEKNKLKADEVHEWLDGTVSEAIIARAKDGVNYVNVAYPNGFTEGQKLLAQILLGEEGYAIDNFFIATLEIRF